MKKLVVVLLIAAALIAGNFLFDEQFFTLAGVRANFDALEFRQSQSPFLFGAGLSGGLYFGRRHFLARRHSTDT